MVFARKVWHLLVAIKDGLALLLLLLFFLLLFAVLSARPSAGTVRDGALLLKLEGSVVEEPAIVDPIATLLSSRAPTRQYRSRDIVRALRLAAHDDRIKAVVLDLARFTGGGTVHMQDIGAALDEVRAARKPVLTYALGYADDGVLLAAHSSEVWVNPMGGAFVLGPGGNHLYFAGLLEKLKINARVYRVGTFKSAVEPYLLDGQSPAARENAQALYGAVFEDWKADVLKARPRANLALATTDPAAWLRASGGDGAQAAKAAGLVDRIGDETAFGTRVAEVVGKDTIDPRPGRFAYTALNTWLAANPPEQSGRAIGVVTIAGEIVDGEAGPGTAGGNRIADLLDAALAKDYAGLVVRVDSPGGSVMASEKIRAAIDRFRARRIPVVVSMANVAASGGYWVSTPANRVFAEPATITGSIGIFAVITTFERSLAELGVHSDGVQTTPLSGQPDPLAGFNPVVDSMIQANVEHGYGQFVGLVAKARGKTPAQIDAIAQGRVWDGGTARQIGLIDQFGGLDDALVATADMAKLKPGAWHAEYLGIEVNPYTALISRMTDDEDSAPPSTGDFTGLLGAREAALAQQAVGDLSRLLLRSHGMQAFCLECATELPSPKADDSPIGWLAMAVRLFGK